MISCSKVLYPCSSGWMSSGWDWVTSNGGLATDASYPYSSYDVSFGTVAACKSSVTVDPDSKVKSISNVNSDVNSLMSAVAKQPVAVSISTANSIYTYKSGIFQDTGGSSLGVLLVGYGTLNGIDYWKVKNSWGKNWGMNGYMLILRSSANKLNILSYASYPNL